MELKVGDRVRVMKEDSKNFGRIYKLLGQRLDGRYVIEGPAYITKMDEHGVLSYTEVTVCAVPREWLELAEEEEGVICLAQWRRPKESMGGAFLPSTAEASKAKEKEQRKKDNARVARAYKLKPRRK